MTIETYAKQIGINATDEQLEKLKQYLEHKPKAGDVYLIPLTVIFPYPSVEGDVASTLPDGAELLLKSEYFTSDRLASNQTKGLTAKFKVGQKVRKAYTGSIVQIDKAYITYSIRYLDDDRVSPNMWSESELEAVEE